MFYQNLYSFVLEFTFLRWKLDYYVYYKKDWVHFLFITLYVDDMLFFGNNKNVNHDLKSYLKEKFDMKDLGDRKYILWSEIMSDRGNTNIWLS